MYRHAAVCLCLIALGAPGRMLPSQNTEPTFRSGGEEVLLDVVARDKKGQPVTNLKPGDIEVFDNGSKRPITSFQLIEGSKTLVAGNTGTAPSAQALDPLRQLRLITLIFNRLDNVNDRIIARNAALDLIRVELPQNVFVSVLVLDQSLKALAPFTADRDIVREAIQKATTRAYAQFDAESAQIQQQLQQVVGPSTAGESTEEKATTFASSSAGNTGPSGATGGQSGASKAMAQMLLNMLQLERTAAVAQSGRAAITGLLDAVRGQYLLPGRKSIFLFSNGFSVPQGMEENYRTVISTANRFNVTFYSIDTHGLATDPINDASASQLRGAAAASRGQFAHSPQVTPQMAREIDTAIESGRANTQNFLAELANSTGGFLMANQNDFRAEMRRAVEDIETYYELSYNPGIEKYDGSFRKIALTSDRPAVRLFSRSGYFALPRSIGGGGQVLAPYEVPLLRAINSKPSPRDLEIHSAALHFRQAQDPICALVIDLPLQALTFEKEASEQTRTDHKNSKPDEARFRGELAYVLLVKNQSGEVVRNFRGDVPLNPKPEQLDAMKRSHFVYTEHFALSPGRYLLETAVMDRKSNKVSVRKSNFLMPAALPTLAISSISVVRSVRDNAETASGQDPFATGNKLITPTLAAVSKQDNGQGLSLYAVIYPTAGSSEKPELTIRFNKDGQNLGGGSPALGQADAENRIQYAATVPLEKFEPGNYEVTFSVKQGNQVAEESTTFQLD